MPHVPDGWVAISSTGGDSWLMPAESTSEADDDILAGDFTAVPEAEPDWLSAAAAHVSQRNGEAEEKCDSPPPVQRERNRSLVLAAEPERRMPVPTSTSPFTTVLILVLLASLVHLSFSYQALSLRHAKMSERVETYSTLASQAKRIILEDLKGTETALAHAHAELLEAAAERRELEEEYRAAAAERESFKAETQSLEDALARSDTELTETRDELEAAKANVRAFSESAEEARKELAAARDSACTSPQRPVATVDEEERRELLREARAIVAEGEKARKQEREAWQRRLAEHRQQTEALEVMLQQARKEVLASEAAHKKEREALQRRTRAAAREEEEQGSSRRKKQKRAPSKEPPRRPDFADGTQSGHRRGHGQNQGCHGCDHGHGYSHSRGQSHRRGTQLPKFIPASTASWLGSLYSRYGAVDDWQASLADWQSAVENSVGAMAWPFSSCAPRTAW